MPPDRLQQISQVIHAALTREENDRAAFVHAVCACDEALQREVESLLAQVSGAAAFLSSRPWRWQGRRRATASLRRCRRPTDAHGTVKIGDFDLSIPTPAPDVTQLTVTGTVQAMPTIRIA
jgi:hypothetical protein